MSNKIKDIAVDELQDELVEDSVEVSGEDLEEAMAAKEVDGAAAADEVGKEIKKSAPAQATAPKTKAGMLQAAYNKMAKMKKDEMAKAYEAMCAESHESDEEAMVEQNFEEDLSALVDSEATLSEEFKEKVSLIFEANVKAKVAEEIDRLEEAYATQLEEEVSATKAELVEKVDSYLNYVVENWMEENKLAIQSGLRAEIAEDFMNGLKTLFTESYVDVPESKVDLVDELHSSVEDLSDRLNEATETLMQSAAVIESYQRDEIIREHSRDLADTQVEKLRTMVEGYDVDDDFERKVETIKESLFTKKAVITEGVDEDDTTDTVEISATMAQYLSAIRKSTNQ